MGGVGETTGVGEIKGSSIDGVSGGGNVGSTVGVDGGVVDGVVGEVVGGVVDGDEDGIDDGGTDGVGGSVGDDVGREPKIYSFSTYIFPFAYTTLNCSLLSLTIVSAFNS